MADISEIYGATDDPDARLKAAKARAAQNQTKKEDKVGGITSLLGAAIGAYFGGPAGASIGGQIGGQTGKLAAGGDLDTKDLLGSATQVSKMSGDKKKKKDKSTNEDATTDILSSIDPELLASMLG